MYAHRAGRMRPAVGFDAGPARQHAARGRHFDVLEREHMKRSVVLLVVVLLVGLNGCGQDYATDLVKRSEMLAVARASFEVKPWNEKTFADYFKRGGKYLSIGEVMTSVADGGRFKWKSSKLTDAVHLVEVDIVTGIVETPIKVSFRANVETGDVTIDDLTIQHATGERTTGMSFDQYTQLDTYMRIGSK
jgi:hypothetical protein